MEFIKNDGGKLGVEASSEIDFVEPVIAKKGSVVENVWICYQ